MGWHNGWGMMGGAWFIWLLLFVLIGLVVWMFMRSATAQGRPTGPMRTEQETPLEVLQKRYARGEISREEYERMRRDLQM